MDINVHQLNKLNEEIDAVSADIKEEKAEWKKATTAEDKAFYAQSILRLEDEKKALVASRDRLIANASSISQGKDISIAASPAKLCSRYMRTALFSSCVQMLPLCLRLRLVYSVFLNNFCHICVVLFVFYVCGVGRYLFKINI